MCKRSEEPYQPPELLPHFSDKETEARGGGVRVRGCGGGGAGHRIEFSSGQEPELSGSICIPPSLGPLPLHPHTRQTLLLIPLPPGVIAGSVELTGVESSLLCPPRGHQLCHKESEPSV